MRCAAERTWQTDDVYSGRTAELDLTSPARPTSEHVCGSRPCGARDLHVHFRWLEWGSENARL